MQYSWTLVFLGFLSIVNLACAEVPAFDGCEAGNVTVEVGQEDYSYACAVTSDSDVTECSVKWYMFDDGDEDTVESLSDGEQYNHITFLCSEDEISLNFERLYPQHLRHYYVTIENADGESSIEFALQGSDTTDSTTGAGHIMTSLPVLLISILSLLKIML